MMDERDDWDALAGDYASRTALQPPERALLGRLRGRWADVEMLDLGVGAGRTAFTFAAITRRYVGLDFSPRMIELSRHLVGEDETTRFVVGDARDLSSFGGGAFDVVLFSFNGIDAVGHDDRLRILREVRRVVAGDGVFAFSTHSLRSLPFDVPLPRPSLREPPGATFRRMRRAVRLARLNRRLDLDAVRRRGWALIRDGAHDFSLVLYYVEPERQLEQLAEAGFAVSEVLDMSGSPVDPTEPPRDPHLFFISRPV